MKLIIGLGNIGPDYILSRHNAGFLAIDWLAERWGSGRWRTSLKLQAQIIKATERDSILAKPDTMMNLSGHAARKLMHYYRLTPADLVVIHDDADLGFGDIRMVSSTQTGAGHHGVLSVIEHIGPGFKRIRIGIGRPDQPGRDISNYVLSRFSPDESAQLGQAFAAKLAKLITG